MEKNTHLHMQEVITGSGDPAISMQISKLVKSGLLRKIAPRVYSSNLTDPVENIIRRNIFYLLSKLYPRAILSHRSALEFKPTATGQLFLTTGYTKKIKLPGINLHLLKGSPPVDGDSLFIGELFVSQKARAFLENLQISKKSDALAKVLPLPELINKLEEIVRVHGEDELIRLRDSARRIAEKTNLQYEYQKLKRIIRDILAKNPSQILISPDAKTKAWGLPFDTDCLSLFENLFLALKTSEFPFYPEKNNSKDTFQYFACFESYFSNYIEGNRLDIEEAKLIIHSNRPMPSRKDDSHDLLGTFQLASNRKEMEITPQSPEELINIICYRHAILLSARTNKMPGIFKNKNNFARATTFVDYQLIRGTLLKSFEFYKALDHPFAKAAYMMFVITEVQPFLYGNGLIARIMMNAELVHAHQSKILLTTVYRNDYISALKNITSTDGPHAYIRMLQNAHAFSAEVHSDNINSIQTYLMQCNAFSDNPNDKLKIITQQ